MERKKHIRNLDRIRQMSVEELAPLLVHESYEFDVDYDWENPIETYDAVYNSPSGGVFNNYDDALDDCIQWLNEEPKNDGNDSLNISSPPPGVDGVSDSPHTSSNLRTDGQPDCSGSDRLWQSFHDGQPGRGIPSFGNMVVSFVNQSFRVQLCT